MLTRFRHIFKLQYRSFAKLPNAESYDVVVIGGGSGGLACAKEAAENGKKVAILDYVEPTLIGSKWGLGGTCVNVGCIPKKLMHQASLLGHALTDSSNFGWQTSKQPVTHSWNVLVDGIQSYIKSLNWGYRVQLQEKKVQYLNSVGSFVNEKTIKSTSATGKERLISAENVVIAVGGRPKYPKISGSELGITSDDLFSLRRPPGRTLVVGASYVALECAGFLTSLNYEVDLMIRSIPLRGFDQQMAGLVVENVQQFGVKVLNRCVPKCVEKSGNNKLVVNWTNEQNENVKDVYDTVLWAIGREPKLSSLKLENANVHVDRKSGKILVDAEERTNVANVFAIGDVQHGRLELTPVAIMAGKMLARRLCGLNKELMDYKNVPTTVFAPIEYGFVGLAEEESISKFGANNIEVFHAFFTPLEFTVANRKKEKCYVKAICVKNDSKRVLGLHFLGPNAGEVIQGFAVAVKCGMTLDLLQNTIGIHPTCAEELVKLNITKSSGKDPTVTGC